ncbi:sigma-70 family RNA polymerase sigma factor [Arthrobacter sp. AQ5-06]|nr:sigma-70 family RNA polymerase sigma factor [Arthrobacter sp. AQ5-06]
MGNNGYGEEGLRHRSIQGQGDAFAMLYDLHRDRVFRHAHRLCGHHDAEDIMAASFLELWRRRKQVRVVEGPILPWLLVTATNVARNRARAALRYQRLLNSLPRSQESIDPAAYPYCSVSGRDGAFEEASAHIRSRSIAPRYTAKSSALTASFRSSPSYETKASAPLDC